jgi:class 3 adenylate cyclase
MSRLLRSTIGNDGIQNILNALQPATGKGFCIIDSAGKIIFGNQEEGQEFPVFSEDEKIGMVKGSMEAEKVAGLLNHLIKKEAEKKKLGSEVLNLYKEINLIFNFSEKLAQTINAPSICSITLDEATHVINCESGVVVLLDGAKQKPEIVAQYCAPFFDTVNIYEESSAIHKIIVSGQSEIVSGDNLLEETGIFHGFNSLIYSALKVNDRILGAIILAGNETIPYTAGQLKLLTTLALQASAAIESALLYEKNIREAREREEAMRLVYEATGKFVPYEFIRSLGHNVITDVKLGDQVEKIVTVLFSDIRDYTSLSEKMTPEENFKFVCSFNERMGPAIRKHNGFINQYLGDAIMAIFPRNAADALSAAIDMQKEVDELNKVRARNDESPIRIGVGMHTGPLIMGITGDLDRMDATTISDTVNTASRLEGLTKHYKANIIISAACLNQITNREDFHMRNLGLVQLKGKNESIGIHECFSANPEEVLSKKLDTLPAFNTGITHYINSSFDIAVREFESILELYPDDLTAAFFLDTARKCLAEQNSTGVVEMSIK